MRILWLAATYLLLIACAFSPIGEFKGETLCTRCNLWVSDGGHEIESGMSKDDVLVARGFPAARETRRSAWTRGVTERAATTPVSCVSTTTG